jgi:hypothetical protein
MFCSPEGPFFHIRLAQLPDQDSPRTNSLLRALGEIGCWRRKLLLMPSLRQIPEARPDGGMTGWSPGRCPNVTLLEHPRSRRLLTGLAGSSDAKLLIAPGPQDAGALVARLSRMPAGAAWRPALLDSGLQLSEPASRHQEG